MDTRVKYNLDAAMTSPNIADMLEPEHCQQIANQVLDGYRKDRTSRAEWEIANADAFKLALQVVEEKSEPWVGCSNVKFPLVTVAALHFHARAYAMLINDNDLVKAKVFGPDPKGEKSARCARIGAHMTWQCMEQMPNWESETDKGLLIQPILGMFFKKVTFDPVFKRNNSEVVSPKDLVINYWTKCNINDAPRASHILSISRNTIHERVTRGVWCNHGEVDDDSTYANRAIRSDREPMQDEFTAEQQKADKMTRPPMDDATPIEMIEQMCWYDLDDDGYMEPYFVTVETGSGRLRRIVARWSSDGVFRTKDGDIIKIAPDIVYIKFGFIPSPDGSYYDLGFGRMLGPINASVDTALNQMIDAGAMATQAGGFVGRGAKMKSGSHMFRPMEWKQIDVIGSSLRDNIVPLPVREPSQTLFQLMGFLVQYAERIASANDLQVGENIGQNTPAQTAETMNMNGQRVFSAIYKRDWRAFKDEYCALYQLNRYFLTADPLYDDLVGPGGMIMPNDYDSPTTAIRPAADPNVISDVQRLKQAEGMMALAFKVPGFNRYQSVRRYLEAQRVPGIDEIFPQPPPNKDGTPGDLPSPPDAKMLEVQVKQGKLQLESQQMKLDATTQQIETKIMLARLQGELQEMSAKVTNLLAQAEQYIAEAESERKWPQIELLNTAIGAYKTRMDGILKWVDHLLTADKQNTEKKDAATSGDNGGGEGGMVAPSGDTGLFTAAGAGTGGDQAAMG